MNFSILLSTASVIVRPSQYDSKVLDKLVTEPYRVENAEFRGGEGNRKTHSILSQTPSFDTARLTPSRLPSASSSSSSIAVDGHRKEIQSESGRDKFSQSK